MVYRLPNGYSGRYYFLGSVAFMTGNSASSVGPCGGSASSIGAGFKSRPAVSHAEGQRTWTATGHLIVPALSRRRAGGKYH